MADKTIQELFEHAARLGIAAFGLRGNKIGFCLLGCTGEMGQALSCAGEVYVPCDNIESGLHALIGYLEQAVREKGQQ
jgi:hypothetical protein